MKAYLELCFELAGGGLCFVFLARAFKLGKVFVMKMKRRKRGGWVVKKLLWVITLPFGSLFGRI